MVPLGEVMNALTPESYQDVHNRMIDLFNAGNFDEAVNSISEDTRTSIDNMPFRDDIYPPSKAEGSDDNNNTVAPQKVRKPTGGKSKKGRRPRNTISNWIDCVPDELMQTDELKSFDDKIRDVLVQEGNLPFELAFTGPGDNTINNHKKKHKPGGGKGKRNRRKPDGFDCLTSPFDGFDGSNMADVPLGDIMNMLTPQSWQTVHNKVNSLYLQGAFDDALNSIPEDARTHIDNTKVDDDNSAPGESTDSSIDNTINKWLNFTEGFKLTDPMINDFDAKIRKVLVDNFNPDDLQTTVEDTPSPFNHPIPLSDIVGLLTPESYQTLHDVLIDLNKNGAFDNILKDLPQAAKDLINDTSKQQGWFDDMNHTNKPELDDKSDKGEPTNLDRNTIMNWLRHPDPLSLLNQDGVKDFDACLRSILGAIPDLQDVAFDPIVDRSVQANKKRTKAGGKGRKGRGDRRSIQKKNDLEVSPVDFFDSSSTSDVALSENFSLLNAESQDQVHAIVNNMIEEGVFDASKAGIPDSIRESIINKYYPLVPEQFKPAEYDPFFDDKQLMHSWLLSDKDMIVDPIAFSFDKSFSAAIQTEFSQMELAQKMDNFSAKFRTLETPLYESFEMLVAADTSEQMFMHKVLADLGKHDKVHELIEDLPSYTRNGILREAFNAPEGVVTGGTNVDVLQSFVYYKDDFNLSEPAALELHDWIRDRVCGVIEKPLAEVFAMLIAEDTSAQMIMHNVLAKVANDDELNSILAKLPQNIQDDILKMQTLIPQNVINDDHNHNVLQCFMYYKNRDGLSDPAALLMRNFIRDKLSDKAQELKPLSRFESFGTLYDKLITSSLGNVDFIKLMEPLTEDSRNNILAKVRADIESDHYDLLEHIPMVEEIPDGDVTRRGQGRRTRPEDILNVLAGKPGKLTDEFKCECERFIRDFMIESLYDYPAEVQHLLDDRKTITVGITPVMKANEVKLVQDCFMVDTNEDMIFQLLTGMEDELVGSSNHSDSRRLAEWAMDNELTIIDANAAAVGALGHNKMSSVVGHSFDMFMPDEDDHVLPAMIAEAARLRALSKSEIRTAAQEHREPSLEQFILAPFLMTLHSDNGSDLLVSTRIQYDLDQMSEEGRLMPILMCKLQSRPLWEKVQNGPVIISRRASNYTRDVVSGEMAIEYSDIDDVKFVNDKAYELTHRRAGTLLPTEDDNSKCFGLTMAEGSCSPNDLPEVFKDMYTERNTAEEPCGVMVDLQLPTNTKKEGKKLHANITSIFHGRNPDDNQYRNFSLQHEEVWGVMIDGSGSILLATDLQGRIVDLNNEAVEKMSGDDDGVNCSYAEAHIGRHFTRYVDWEDRKIVQGKFELLIKSETETHTCCTIEKSITLISNDFTFDIGNAGYEMLVRLQLYPHFDKNGKIAGVVFEGYEVSGQVLEARVADHIFGLQGYPLEYNQPDLQTIYDEYDDMLCTDLDDLEDEYGCRSLRQMHGPMIGLDRLFKIQDISHAALVKLEIEDEYDELIGVDFVNYLDSSVRTEFEQQCRYVLEKAEAVIVDSVLKDVGGIVSKHTRFSIAPWYGKKAETKGIIVGMMGTFLSAFSMDQDGFVLDCTREAANTLGYNVGDLVGKSLIRYVDQDSAIDALDALEEIIGVVDEEEDYFDGEISKVLRINMLRQTNRVIQTTWDAFMMPGSTPEKKTAIVVMHKERMTHKNRVKADKQVVEDAEEKHLNTMQPVERKQTNKKKETVELTAVERAQKQTIPCNYHYCVMQRFSQLDENCDFEMFRKYLTAVWMEKRPWELHSLRVFDRPRIRKKFIEILSCNPQCIADSYTPDETDMLDFDTWKIWWSKSENRTSWDGGELMTHLVPPGCMDPYDYDKK
jgi:PAS domain-containing protein